jgi:PST family polysaccharide transporter
MSGTIGIVAAALTLVAAPIAAAYYHEPQIKGLLMVAALGLPLASLAVVPEARLSAQMRFGLLAKVGMLSVLLSFALSILFAGFLGWGAYSILLPAPIVALVRLPIFWIASDVKVQLSPCFRHWPSLFGTSATVWVASVIMMVTYVGQFSVLERMTANTDLVGAFYLMHQLSDQPTRVIVANLAAVLLPTLALLYGDPQRQLQGFERAIRTLFLVGAPVCALQAVLSGPVVRLLLPMKYHSSGWLLSLLSLYMVGRLALSPIEAMLIAQRRQGTWMRIAVVYAPAYLAACAAGIWLGKPDRIWHIGHTSLPFGPGEGCTIGMMLCFNTMIPIALTMCFSPLGSARSRAWKALQIPLIWGSLWGLIGAAIVHWMPLSVAGDIAALVITPVVVTGGYYWVCRRYAASDLNDILGRIGSIAPKRIAHIVAKLRSDVPA